MPSFSSSSTARKDANQHSAEESSTVAPPCYEPGKHCAYNQTRERFLSADLDAADFTTANLISRLSGITSESGTGLWMVPFRGIAPTSVRVPVDLICLDINCKVIEIVESFPLARVSASAASAASVVVLPAESISSTETRAGDQLILCPPEEMKRRLQKLAEAPQEAAPAPAKDESSRNATGRVLQMEDRLRSRGPEGAQGEDRIADRIADRVAGQMADRGTSERVVAPIAEPVLQPAAGYAIYEPVREVAAPPVVSTQEAPAKPSAEAVQPPAKKGKSWLQRVLGLEPPDPRKALRESLDGLSAYFFTGGTPVAHSVRDISLTGLYVLTSERWYPGTMVRMTLTDRHEPTIERSITLHATVMRSGDDGVGLRFVLQNPKDRRRPSDGTAATADIAQVEQFIQRLRGSAS